MLLYIINESKAASALLRRSSPPFLDPWTVSSRLTPLLIGARRTPSFRNKPSARCFNMGPVRFAGAHYAGLHCTGVAAGEKEVLSMARCSSFFCVHRQRVPAGELDLCPPLPPSLLRRWSSTGVVVQCTATTHPVQIKASHRVCSSMWRLHPSAPLSVVHALMASSADKSCCRLVVVIGAVRRYMRA